MPKKKTIKKKKRVNGNRKGKTAERKLVPLFAKWWGSEFFRTPESGGMSTRLTKMLGIDFSKFAGDVITLDETFPFCVESKKVEKWSLEQLLTSDKTKMHDWWAQTLKETPINKIPLLVFTRNHAPLYAMLPYDEYYQTYLESVDSKFFEHNMPQAELGIVLIFPLEDLFKTDKTKWLLDEKLEGDYLLLDREDTYASKQAESRPRDPYSNYGDR